MTKTQFLLLIVLLVAIGGTAAFFTRDNDTDNMYSDLIRITMPRAGDAIESPLTVSGAARGTWYFEASFPITLEDEDGHVLAERFATAEGGWMTEDFVPFTAEVPFSVTAETPAFLVLHKDNPSGLSENDDSVRIPVTLLPGAEEMVAVRVFFGRNDAPAGEECTTVVAAERRVPKTIAVARVALLELLKGPTEAEKAGGYFTSIPDGVVIQSLIIEDGVARADFSGDLEEQVGGSCRVTHIRKQITETLLQFGTVQSIIISIDGRTEDILQP